MAVFSNIGNGTHPVGTVSLSSYNDLLGSFITGAIHSTNLNLTSTSGDVVGSSNTPFSTNIANVSANAAGKVYISDTASGAVTINGASSAGTDFKFVATNASSLSTTATIDAGNTSGSSTVELTAQAGSLSVGAAIGNNVTPVGTVSLSSYNDLQSQNITGTVNAGALALTSTNGNIDGSSTSTPFLTNVANITANANGVVNINDSNSGVTTIGGASSAGTSFTLVTAGSLTQGSSSDTITASTANLTSTNGSIYGSGGTSSNFIMNASNLVANANAASQNVYLSDTASGGTTISGASGAAGTFSLLAAGNLTQGSTSDTITATSANLSSTNGSIYGSGGTSSNFLLSASNVIANANAANQNVYISDSSSGAVAINGASGAGNIFSLTAPNATSLATTATIDVGNTNAGAVVTLTASVGSLSLGGAIGNNVTPVGTVNLISCNDLQSANITGTLNANALTLTSANGNIDGSSTSTAFTTNVANITANASGVVNINDSNSGATTIGGASSAGTSFTLTTAGSLTQSSSSDTITASTCKSNINKWQHLRKWRNKL